MADDDKKERFSLADAQAALDAYNAKDKISLAAAQAALDASDAALMQKRKSEGQPLQGGIFNDEQNKEISQETRQLFPQPNEAPESANAKKALFPLKATAMGIEAAPEELANLGLGAAQTAAGVPQGQGKSFADLVRMVPGQGNYVSSAELMQSPQYQQAVNQSRAGQIAGAGGALLGGAMMPIGGIGSAVGRVAAPVARTLAPAAIPAFRALPQVIQAGARMIAPHALAGAGYSTAFGSGAQFGATRQLPSPGQVAGLAGLGAVLGTGVGAGLAGAGKLIGAVAGRYGNRQPVVNPPVQQAQAQQVQARLAQLQQLANHSPQAVQQRYSNALDLAESGLGQPNRAGQVRTPQQTEQTQKYLIGRAQREMSRQPTNAGGLRLQNTKGQQEALTALEKHFLDRKLARQRQETNVQRQDQRTQHSQQNQREKEQRGEQRQADRETRRHARTGLHTQDSGSFYRDLYDHLRNAESPEELRQLERDIYDPGEGPDGKRLLDGRQQSNLMQQFHRRMRELNTEPGMPEEDIRGSEPISQPVQVSKPTVTKEFVTGETRKTISERHKPAQNRHELAISVDTLGEDAQLKENEVSALHRWVADLANVQHGTKLREIERERLIDWAWNNPRTLLKSPDGISLAQEGDRLVLIKRTNAGVEKLYLSRTPYIHLSTEIEKRLATKRDELLAEGIRRGDIDPVYDMEEDREPSLAITTNGKATRWAEAQDGRLHTEGMKALQPASDFSPPKDLEELWERAAQLRRQLAVLNAQKKLIKSGAGKYDYLNGRRLVDLLKRAMDKLDSSYRAGQDPQAVPGVRLWHVDGNGIVSDLVFRQPKQVLKFTKKASDLARRYAQEKEKIHTEHGAERFKYAITNR